MKEFVVIHYYEIALKGKNRSFFEKVLVKNIKKILKHEEYDYVKRLRGRIVIKLNQNSNKNKIKRKLKKIFGIAYFAFSFEGKPDIFFLRKDILKIIQLKKFNSFKIETKRADKQFFLTSQKINEKIGEFIKKKLNKKVDLKKPDLTVFIEFLKDRALFYFKKIKGLSGLPVGVSGKVFSLISSGFDSPVASYLLMKRGCQVIFIHFHSYPQTSLASKNAVEEIIKILNCYQFSSKLYFIPFLDIQKEIASKAPSHQRIILYRRAMLKIAELIAKREKATALVVGDSIGQVSSQTLENIFVISRTVKFPILRPLAGMNKEEIIKISKKIGTFKISVLNFEDCCNLFIPSHPETKADLKKILEIEKNLNLKNLIRKAIRNSELKVIASIC